MFNRSLLVASLLAIASPAAYATQFNFDLNNDAFEAGFGTAIGPGAEVSANYMYSRPEGDLADIGIKATHQHEIHKFSIGAKFTKLWANNRANAHAAAIGGDYAITVAQNLTVSGSAYYAPSVLTSSELNRYYDLDAKIAYSIMPQADVYLGYRAIQFRYSSQQDLDFNKGLYIGAAFNF
ncbi:YfaZ family outer membrane protein [Agarivorans sp. MS3-6]